MEDAKKLDEAAKPEELAERVELTDEELDQASGGRPQFTYEVACGRELAGRVPVLQAHL